jgi:hypothetical protein
MEHYYITETKGRKHSKEKTEVKILRQETILRPAKHLSCAKQYAIASCTSFLIAPRS